MKQKFYTSNAFPVTQPTVSKQEGQETQCKHLNQYPNKYTENDQMKVKYSKQ